MNKRKQTDLYATVELDALHLLLSQLQAQYGHVVTVGRRRVVRKCPRALEHLPAELLAVASKRLDRSHVLGLEFRLLIHRTLQTSLQLQSLNPFQTTR